MQLDSGFPTLPATVAGALDTVSDLRVEIDGQTRTSVPPAETAPTLVPAPTDSPYLRLPHLEVLPDLDSVAVYRDTTFQEFDVSDGQRDRLTPPMPVNARVSTRRVAELRQISGVAQTVTDTWQGVTSAGVAAEWTDEAEEVADASPTLGSSSIPFVPFSFEVQGDAVNFMSEPRPPTVR